MGGPRPRARLLAAVLVAAFAVLLGGGPALAGPARPTADPSAPTPSAPYPGRPPQGEAPDGRTAGGEELDTRGLVVAEDTPPLPALTAPAWLVADAGTGEVLAARDPHGRYYPASTLKTLTLLTLLPVLDPRMVVTGTVEDENIEGTRIGIVAGGRYSVQLLFEGLMLASGNDAANALARRAGGVATTVEAMNEKAWELGAFDTVVGTPSGLDVAGQSSSVYDLALIFRALLEEPGAAAVLTAPIAHMPAVPGRFPGFQIQNKNPLLGRHPGNLGGKNGFTTAARHGFVTAAERGGRRIVASVLGSEATPVRAADQAAQLLDWGFSVPAAAEGVGTLIRPAEARAHTRPPAPRRDDAFATPPALAAPTETSPSDAQAPPVVPVVLATVAVVIVGATLVGRRRAVRRPGPYPSSSPPERAAPGSSPASPSTPP